MKRVVTRYRLYFVKEGDIPQRINLYRTRKRVASFYIWQMLWEVGYLPPVLVTLEDGVVCRPDTTHTEWQIPVSYRYSNFLLMMGTWMPETCREEK